MKMKIQHLPAFQPVVPPTLRAGAPIPRRLAGGGAPDVGPLPLGIVQIFACGDRGLPRAVRRRERMHAEMLRIERLHEQVMVLEDLILGEEEYE